MINEDVIDKSINTSTRREVALPNQLMMKHDPKGKKFFQKMKKISKSHTGTKQYRPGSLNFTLCWKFEGNLTSNYMYL